MSVDRGVTPPKRFSVLGVTFNAVQIPDVILQMRQWISLRRELPLYRCRWDARDHGGQTQG